MPWRALLALGILLACCPFAFALDPSLHISQYAHTAWSPRDGISNGLITSIAQTPDGYLWLGTEFGLLRFDGVRSVTWQSPAGEQLPSSYVKRLLAARDGTLWIGTTKGLVSWKDGKLTQYAKLDGFQVQSLLEDREGTVWVGTFAVPSGRLCAIHSGSTQCYGEDGSLGTLVTPLYEDSRGNLWVGSGDRLWRWNPGPPKDYRVPNVPNGIQGLVEGDNGRLLFSTNDGLRQLVGEKIEAYRLPAVGQAPSSRKMLRDGNGGLWIATQGNGLLHVHQGKTDTFAQSDGLSGDTIQSLFEDREGNIWVSTNNGLDRFRDFAVSTISVRQGLSNDAAWSVVAATDGSVWVGTSRGLNRLKNGHIMIYRGRTTEASRGGLERGREINGVAAASNSEETAREITDSGLPGEADSFAQDDLGRIWVTMLRGVAYFENDRFVPVGGVPGGEWYAIAGDRAGNTWISNQDQGLFHLLGASVVEEIPWAKIERKDSADFLLPDPVQGGVWLAYFKGGIDYLKGGRVGASYSAADGLGAGRVGSLQFDSDGTLWAATAGGLSRIKDGHIVTLTSKNGLPCDTDQWALEDDEHAFWLYMDCGLVRIARPELDAWTADPKRKVQATVFDSSDGITAHALIGGYGPRVTRSADGRLWLVSGAQHGVSVVDPRNLHLNKLPPPVHVEQITADRKTYWQNSFADESSSRPKLPPLVRDLEIDYTALSLVAPEKNRFRVELEGWDRDWQDVGNRRQAFYNNLSSGNYRFRVAASNNSGVWNEAGTFLDFSIAPAYYQTTWFRLSCVVAFLAMLWVLYQLRLRQAMQRVRHHMQGRLVERERIARELHDTLLQSVQGLILKFDAVAKQIPRDEPARMAMDEALDRADEVMGEGRERVRSLRAGASALSNLPAAFQRVADETAPGRDATFKTIVEGNVRELNPMVLEESYSIGREALINALAHSGGLHVEVEIMYDPRQFRLRIRDDGRGVDPRILEKGGRPGHWGMQGMRERAQGMGAQLGLWSRPGSGTEVELLVPAAAAYRSGRAPAKTSWLGRHFGNGR